MKIIIEGAGKRRKFRVVRINYASAHALLAGHEDVRLVAGGERLAPRESRVEGDMTRLTWVFPPAWEQTFPEEVTFVVENERLARVTQTSGLSRVPEAATDTHHRAPFPPGLVTWINRLHQTDFDGTQIWNDAIIERFLEDVLRARNLTKRLGYAGPLARYLGYLRRMETNINYQLRNFPDINTTALRPDRYHAIATAPEEMMTIAHHLYVLQAAGVAGDFAEFGAFKGFSTSFLSRACAELGLTMQVFDSFQGLPPSASGRYLTGEYAGSFREVSGHVADFGAPQVVEWHKGFFSESLRGFDQPLMAIWMDVDLTESAIDVMKALPLLDERGAIFSHELKEAAFADGRPNWKLLEAGRFEVLAPIANAVKARAGDVRGTHLADSMGAVTLPGSIGILRYPHIKRLLEMSGAEQQPPAGDQQPAPGDH